jgi:adenylate kinase
LSELKIFLGPPGAGKGTQAKKVALEFGLAHISTGDMLRGHISNKTDLGKIAKSVMDEGNLVSDDLVIAMLVERLGSNDCKKGAILDGFPRTLPQAKSLEEIKNKFPVSKVFVFEVDEEELVQRILLRGQTSGRSDDTEESIKVRFEVYSQDTEPLIDFYNQQDKVVKINAVGDIDEIYHNIAKHFN